MLTVECTDCPERDCMWCSHSGDEHRDEHGQIFRTGERPYVEAD